MKINTRSLKTAFLFSLLVFVILFLTMFLSLLLTWLFWHAGILKHPFGHSNFIAFAFSSIIIGTILSKVLGRHPIATIVEISEATKEVARGNFNVALNEDIRVSEFHTMAHNFNVMTKELANTEMLRNDFIENVSHEFKTPLSAIEGYVTLLQKKNLSEEKRLEYTERIMINTKRLSTLTGNILLLSRLENQEIQIKKERFSLDEQLRENILLFEPQWSEKEIEFDIELDSVDYYGNRELLSQVWQNLLSNAIKFVDKQGMIRIILHDTASNIQVSISDNGIGMSEEIIKRIYEKFYQGDTSRSSSGNGLGLALAKRIIDLHDGLIEVSSQETKGSSFTVTLPKKG